LASSGTMEFWWNFDHLDDIASPHHYHHPPHEDRNIQHIDGEYQNAIWYFGVPNLEDFGTNVLLEQYNLYDPPYGSHPPFHSIMDATCGQWLHRVWIIPQKCYSKSIRHLKTKASIEYSNVTEIPRRSYSVLR
jgi:hypothetical protein